MLLKIGHIYQATPVLDRIISEKRPLPQKGSYRIARLYGKLKPEYDLIYKRRDAMIEAYQHKEMLSAKDVETGEVVLTEAENFSVPADKVTEFYAAWAEVANEEIEVAVEPVPLAMLSKSDSEDGAITALELLALDDLVTE